MNIALIVAAADNNAIGYKNQMLWHLPNDFKFFKNKTWGLPVIMGRKTFESMGSKALAGRYNIVITSQTDFNGKGVEVVHSLDAALEAAKAKNYNEIMIIGGASIYTAALPLAKTVYLTRVKARPKGDTFFPVLSPNEWFLSFSEKFTKDAKHAYTFNIETWVRK